MKHETQTRQRRITPAERRRREKIRRNVISAALGILIGLLAGLGHVISVNRYKAELREYISEQIKADRAYEAEVEAERAKEKQDFTTVDIELEYFDPDIPIDVQRAAYKAELKYGISVEFLEAIAYYESRYQTDAVSPNGDCVGVMQVSLKYHSDRAAALGYKPDDLYTAEANIDVAADYLLELFMSGSDDPHYVLMRYNGDRNAKAYLSGDAEASPFAVKVMELYRDLSEKHLKGGDAVMDKN